MGTLQEKAVCSFTCIMSCCACCVIKEVVNKDVLLPCVVREKGVVRLSEVTVNWQGSETQEIVHSFYNGKDHLEHQGERFRGRTHLFHEEFSKGNASLLLKSLTLRDTGNYSCHAFLYDEALPSEQVVQLSVSEEEIQIEHGQNLCILIGVLLSVLVLLCFVLYEWRHRRRKSKGANLLQEAKNPLTKGATSAILRTVFGMLALSFVVLFVWRLYCEQRGQENTAQELEEVTTVRTSENIAETPL